MSHAVAAVLCGGASRRMGIDKATLLINGVPMAARVASVSLAAGCRSVVAVGGDAATLAAIGLDYVADMYPGEGPLGGVITSLTSAADAHAESVLVVACDLPHVTVATLAAVLGALGDHDVAVARTDRPEPMCAVWRSTVLSQLTAMFASGVRSVAAAIEQLDTVMVDAAVDTLRNVNTPDDLDQCL